MEIFEPVPEIKHTRRNFLLPIVSSLVVFLLLVLILGQETSETQQSSVEDLFVQPAVIGTQFASAETVFRPPQPHYKKPLVASITPRRTIFAAGVNDLMEMFFRPPSTMVTASQALKGRLGAEILSNKHFVLGTPLRAPFPEGIKTAIFATGCYWGTEKGYWRLPGVYSTAVGYAGGFTPNPTYNEACSGKTGHTEAVFVAYDPKKVAYSDLLKLFFESHDPSQFMGQGNDMGTQYRSAIYTESDEELSLAKSAANAYSKALGRDVASEIKPQNENATPFFYAHEEYQQYLARPGARMYCSAQPQGVELPPFASWASKEFQTEEYAPKLPPSFWEKHGPKPGCTIGRKDDVAQFILD